MADPKSFTWEPPDRNLSIAVARYHFLAAVEAIAPEVLEWLYEKAFPYFKINHYQISDSSLMESKIKTFMEPGKQVFLVQHLNDLMTWSNYQIATKEVFPDLLPLKKRIDEWTDKYNLHSEEDWIQIQALKTMQFWAQFGEVADSRNVWGLYPGGMCWNKHKPLIIELPEVDDSEMTRSQIEKKLEGYFRKQITEYLDEIEDDKEARGWEKQYKRTSIKRFNWLVYYQIKGLSHREIVKEYLGKEPGITRKSKLNFAVNRRVIGAGITEAAIECKISLRPPASLGKNVKTGDNI